MRFASLLVHLCIGVLFLCFGMGLQAQTTIYSEDFESTALEEGLTGALNATTGPFSFTSTNGKWSLSVPTSPIGLTATTDWARVEDGAANFGSFPLAAFTGGSRFLQFRDVDEPVTFQTQSIDISNYTSASISVNVFENGSMEPSGPTDFLEVAIIVDGNRTVVQTLVDDFSDAGSTTASDPGNTNPTVINVSSSGITGNSLIVEVVVDNNAGTEYHNIDDITVTATGGTPPPPPPASIDIVINEIHYNGPTSGSDPDEFVELFNNGSGSVDISGWTFTQGFVFTFPQNTSIAAGEYIVIAVDAADFQAEYGFAPDFEWTSGALANGGEDIELRDASNAVQDVVDYDNSSPWPPAANGGGPSLELIDPALDNSLPASWTASPAPGGSPKALNGTGCTLGLTTNSPSCDANTSGTDTYTVSIDFTGGGADTYTLTPNAGNLAAGSDDPNSVATGTLTYENIPEGSDLDFSITSTGGCNVAVLVSSPSCEPPLPVVINEIMYNPIESGTDLTEYIELYNSSSSPVDLSGFSFTGVTFTFPTGASIAGGEYLVVAGNATEFENFYGCAPDYEWTSGALSNNGELILVSSASSSEVDRVSYDDGNGWPTAPDGDGPSLELIDPNGNNNDPANWEASAGFGTPGADNAGTATGCVPDPPGSFVLTSLSIATQLFPRLTWTESTGADSYTVQLSIAGGPFENRATLSATARAYTDSLAVFGQSITYRIEATNAGGSTLSNTLSLTTPATITRLELSFNCYDPNSDELVWNVNNPNIQNIPFIWAQYWTPARDTLIAPSFGTSMFRTANNPQNGATPGDDNTTGIWWIDETLSTGIPNDVIFTADLSQTCTAPRLANPNADPAPQWMKESTFFVNLLNLPTDIEEEIAAGFKLGPNPFINSIFIEAKELTGNSPVRLLDMTGRVVLQTEIQLGSRVELQVPELSKGIYLLEIGKGKHAYTTKMVKE